MEMFPMDVTEWDNLVNFPSYSYNPDSIIHTR